MRKIRRDAVSPQYGNCRLSDADCKYEAPRRKRGPQPMRASRQLAANVVERLRPSTQRRHDVLEPSSTVPANVDTPTAQALPAMRDEDVSLTTPELERVHSNLMWPSPIVLSGTPSTHASTSTSVTVMQNELAAALAELLPDPRALVERSLETFM